MSTIKIEKIKHMNLEHTFLCGQCFRWNKQPDGSFIGVAHGRAIKAVLDNDALILEGAKSEDEDMWREYFDLNSDYGAIKDRLSKDKIIKKCIEYGFGIRILKQDVWETIVSFIISSNNNIPRIKKIIEKLCELYGVKIDFEGKLYYSFPSAETLAKLSLSDLAEIRAGFRDKYILDAARKVAENHVDLKKIQTLSIDEARYELMKISGIGKKVADCVLLFGMGRHSVFPQDVWIKRILYNEYSVDENEIDRFATEMYGDFGGFAQQYLYYYYSTVKT